MALNCFSKEDLKNLYGKAKTFLNSGYYSYFDCEVFYRNKDPEYFEDILNSGGLMTKIMNDNGGDKRSPINGCLEGLFFLANVDYTSQEPPTSSPFGSKRLSIPAFILLENTNLYFADFYCMNNAHYMIIVLAEKHSDEDLFCRTKLLPLRKDNPFLKMVGNQLKINGRVWVEIFYADNINLSYCLAQGATFTNTDVTFQGHSTPNGIPKKPGCDICNL